MQPTLLFKLCLRRSSLSSLAAIMLVAVLTSCGGSSDSGGGDSSMAPDDATGGATGDDPTTDGEPSNNNPASGFYDGPMTVMVSGGRSDFVVRLRVVIDPGGGVAVFENDILRSQARMGAGEFNAESDGARESLFSMTCTAKRRYEATVIGTNASVQGTYIGEFACSDDSTPVLRGSFSLPRTGDHQ